MGKQAGFSSSCVCLIIALLTARVPNWLRFVVVAAIGMTPAFVPPLTNQDACNGCFGGYFKLSAQIAFLNGGRVLGRIAGRSVLVPAGTVDGRHDNLYELAGTFPWGFCLREQSLISGPCSLKLRGDVNDDQELLSGMCTDDDGRTLR